MTNPDNAIGTNAAYGGRTSVNARNDVLGLFNGRGVLSGWACSPDSGMTVVLGGDGSTRDVAIVEDASGNRTTVDNISGSPVPVTLPAAPASNSRIDSIVAYVNNPPSGSATVIDNPEACGIIAVSGTASSSPQAPNDTAIRQAITADGASGSTAYYVVLANVTVASGTTDITAGDITAGDTAKILTSSTDNTMEVITANSGIAYKFSNGFMICVGGGDRSVNNNAYADLTLQFAAEFKESPYTVVCLATSSTAYQMGSFSVAWQSNNTRQVNVRCFNNNTGSARQPYVRYFATGFWK